MVRYRIIFTGLVQGVGFRYFVSRTARMQGLTGFVQNLNDGRAEAEVQGNEDQFASFLATVREGNGYARVGDFSIQHIDLYRDEGSFTII